MEHSVWVVITIHIKTNGKNKRRKRWTFWNTNRSGRKVNASFTASLSLNSSWNSPATHEGWCGFWPSPKMITNQPKSTRDFRVGSGKSQSSRGRGTKWEAELRTVANFWDADTLRGAGVNLDLLRNTSPGLMTPLPPAVPKAEMFPSRETVRAAQAAFPAGHRHSCLPGHQTLPSPIRLCKSWAGEMGICLGGAAAMVAVALLWDFKEWLLVPVCRDTGQHPGLSALCLPDGFSGEIWLPFFLPSLWTILLTYW